MKGSAEVKIVWHIYAGDNTPRYQGFCDDMPCKGKGKIKIAMQIKITCMTHTIQQDAEWLLSNLDLLEFLIDL